MTDKVSAYINKHSQWQDELTTLRRIFQETKLEETLKWGAPVYTINGKNVAGLGAFKRHCALWFFNGVFLRDDAKLLLAAQDKTKALRQIRLEKGEVIPVDTVKAYILEAADNELKGLKIETAKPGQYVLATALNDAFNDNESFRDAFYALSPGKQKEYSNYIAEAKQAKTKQARIEKITSMVQQGIGLYDKYKKS